MNNLTDLFDWILLISIRNNTAQEQWSQQESLDPEQSVGHNRDLYIIWNEKTNFMMIAAKLNYFNSSYFLWLDIGAVRQSVS